MGQYGEDGAGFLKLYRDRGRRRGHELGHRRLKDDTKKSFFSVDVQYGNRGPEGAVGISVLGDAPGLTRHVPDLDPL